MKKSYHLALSFSPVICSFQIHSGIFYCVKRQCFQISSSCSGCSKSFRLMLKSFSFQEPSKGAPYAPGSLPLANQASSRAPKGLQETSRRPPGPSELLLDSAHADAAHCVRSGGMRVDAMLRPPGLTASPRAQQRCEQKQKGPQHGKVEHCVCRL